MKSNGDWRQFFRGQEGDRRRGEGRNERKAPKRKAKSSDRKEKPVKGRKAARTVTKPKRSRR